MMSLSRVSILPSDTMFSTIVWQTLKRTLLTPHLWSSHLSQCKMNLGPSRRRPINLAMTLTLTTENLGKIAKWREFLTQNWQAHQLTVHGANWNHHRAWTSTSLTCRLQGQYLYWALHRLCNLWNSPPLICATVRITIRHSAHFNHSLHI